MSALTEYQIGDRVFVWTFGDDAIQAAYGTNCAAIVGSDSVVLVDPLIAPAHARQVEAALRAHTAAPVRAVVLTHHHTDHTLGAALFARQGAAVIAHQACRERILAEHPALLAERRARPDLADLFADAEVVAPLVTFEQTLTVHPGGLEVEVWHPGWVHTPGDAFVYVPAERVAIAGDLLFNGYHYNYEHARLDQVRRGLDALRALDADVFVPGHGPVAGAEVIDLQAAYHDAVEAVVRDGLAAGWTDEGIVEALRTRFPGYRLEVVLPTAVARLRAHLAR